MIAGGRGRRDGAVRAAVVAAALLAFVPAPSGAQEKARPAVEKKGSTVVIPVVF